MGCEYCQYDDAGKLKSLRDEPDLLVWLEEDGSDWRIVTSVTTQCCGRECTTVAYVRVKHCPMCGRML